MTTVRFNALDEFIEEIRKECEESPPDSRHRPILRITAVFKGTTTMPIRHCHLLATIINPRNEVVKLETYCGDIWGQESIDEKTRTSYEEKRLALVTAFQPLNLDIRAGTFEPDER